MRYRRQERGACEGERGERGGRGGRGGERGGKCEDTMYMFNER